MKNFYIKTRKKMIMCFIIPCKVMMLRKENCVFFFSIRLDSNLQI